MRSYPGDNNTLSSHTSHTTDSRAVVNQPQVLQVPPIGNPFAAPRTVARLPPPFLHVCSADTTIMALATNKWAVSYTDGLIHVGSTRGGRTKFSTRQQRMYMRDDKTTILIIDWTNHALHHSYYIPVQRCCVYCLQVLYYNIYCTSKCSAKEVTCKQAIFCTRWPSGSEIHSVRLVPSPQRVGGMKTAQNA